MFQKLSIAIRGGIEVYSYSSNSDKFKDNSQLLSGLFYAIQSVSEEIKDPVSFIRLQNSVIYVKTYSDFSIQLIFSRSLNDSIIESIFQEIAKLTISFFNKLQNFQQPREFTQKIEKIFENLTKNDFIDLNHYFIPDFSNNRRIALVGLGNAGKTSIKKKFFDNWSINKLEQIKPTIGVEQANNNVDFLNDAILSLDFGGQMNYIKNYLLNPNNWSNLSALIFIVDIQNPELFVKAKSYLDQIFSIFPNLNIDPPYIAIFMHKLDSDKLKEINPNLEKFYNVFHEYSGKVTFFNSSIYDNSSVISMLRVLYYSLPNIMIKQILERTLLDKLEKELINIENISTLITYEKDKLFNLGLQYGDQLSVEFQNQWLNSYIFGYIPTPRAIQSKQVHLKLEGQQLIISIDNWISDGISAEITDTILTGVIKGILDNLFFSEEITLVHDKIKTTWNLQLISNLKN